MLVYFAAFKGHIGFYPPIKGDAELEQAASAYAGDKGNLRFPYDKPIPYDLIGAKKLGYNLTVLPPGKVRCIRGARPRTW